MQHPSGKMLVQRCFDFGSRYYCIPNFLSIGYLSQAPGRGYLPKSISSWSWNFIWLDAGDFTASSNWEVLNVFVVIWIFFSVPEKWPPIVEKKQVNLPNIV